MYAQPTLSLNYINNGYEPHKIRNLCIASGNLTKFTSLQIPPLGTYVTLMGKPKFVLLADEIQNRLVSSKNVAEYVLK